MVYQCLSNMFKHSKRFWFMRWPVSPDLKGSEREKSLRWNLLETTVSSHIVWGCFEEAIGYSKRDASDPVLESWCYNWPCSFVGSEWFWMVLNGSDAYCWISCVRAFKHSPFVKNFSTNGHGPSTAFAVRVIMGHLRLVPRPWPKSYFCETCFVTIPRMPFAWTSWSIASSARRYVTSVTSQGGLQRFLEILESSISSLPWICYFGVSKK